MLNLNGVKCDCGCRKNNTDKTKCCVTGKPHGAFKVIVKYAFLNCFCFNKKLLLKEVIIAKSYCYYIFNNHLNSRFFVLILKLI